MDSTIRLTVGFILLALTEGTGAPIVKRSDDMDPSIAVIEQLTAKISSLEARITADANRLAQLENKVAFKVQFSQYHLDIPTYGSFKFDQVITNDGQAYDEVLGVFIVPFNGAYIFTFQIFTYAEERPNIDIKVNGNTASRMALYTQGTGINHEESNASTMVLKLNHGDRVWVQSATTETTAIYGIYHTFFSGALLYAS